MLKNSVIERMKTYLYRYRYIKAISYENGMEDGWIILLPDMPEGEEYINRVFSTESDAENYITSPLFTREHSGKEYEIVPVMLSILSDDEAENCVHVVPDYRGFEHEFTQVDEESLIVMDENGAVYTMDKDDFSELYEVTLEEFQGTEENMYCPCSFCYAYYGRTYSEDCDNKCTYAHACKKSNDFCDKMNEILEKDNECLKQVLADQKKISNGVDNLLEGIRKNQETMDGNIQLLRETIQETRKIADNRNKRGFFHFGKKNGA